MIHTCLYVLYTLVEKEQTMFRKCFCLVNLGLSPEKLHRKKSAAGHLGAV